ncbi:aminotransferase [Rhizobium lemnae]|uniref:Aminotransferase n=1 Tax=Rhizobium lemnae TaxID=1214924 RepID=A0ABV8E520_9HYPH|nr:aminotransferase [Rhizobium lemnae]MCJ8510365.1 aminotransferase [Rhizobium lemnae]
MEFQNRKEPSLSEIDVAHHLHPFANTKEYREQGVRVITGGDGVYVIDSSGRRYLDAFAGLWCVNVGYGRREIADAVHAQMISLAYYNTFFGTTTEPTARLAERIVKLAGPDMSHVFFTNSGSEANDTWLRMARLYWTSKGMPNRKIVISRQNSYHGSTIAGASLGGMRHMHEQGDLPIPGIVHIGQPYWYAEGGGLMPDQFGILRARELEEKILELGPENVAAFVAEPVQGTGGVIVPPETYWPEILRICRKYDILLAVDEVITGFGRTGSWFGYQHYGLRPDFCSVAKGLSSGYQPIAAVIVSGRVADAMAHEGGVFQHGFTYSGHPCAAAAALANLNILEREDLVGKIQRDLGPYFAKALHSLNDLAIVGETQAIGLLGSVQLVLDKNKRLRFSKPSDIGMIVRNFCMERDLIVRASQDRILLAPAFVITHEQIDTIIATLRAVLIEIVAALS